MKRIGLSIVAVAAAVLAAAAVAPWAVSDATVRVAVAREIHELTGRMPVIAGSARLHLLPYPSVTVEHVSLPGVTAKDNLIEADVLEGTLRLTSLLVGRLEIASVALRSPRLALTVDAEGRRSWAFDDGELAGLASGTADDEVALGSLRLVGGTLVLTDARTGTVSALILDDATVSWSRLDNPLSASGTIGWRGQVMDVSLAVDDPAALIKGQPSEFRGKLDCEILKATASGKVDGDGRFDGKLGFDSPALGEVLAWLGFDAGRSLAKTAFKLRSPATIDSRVVSLPAAQVEIDDNLADGAMTVNLHGARPKVSGTFAAETLDLSPYLGEIASAHGRTERWREDRVKVEPLSLLDLDMRISAAKASVGEARFGPLALGAVIQDGALDLSLGEASGYGGTLTGRMVLKPGEGAPVLQASLAFQTIDVDQALGDMIGFRKLEGTGEGRLDLTGRGETMGELLGTLSGQASIAVENGALLGVDLVDLMRRIERRPLSVNFESRSGRTPFDKGSASFVVTDGTARTADARIDGNGLSVALGGEAGVARRNLDLTGEAILVASAEAAPPFRLPFKIHGGWDWPVVEPDPDALIRRSGAAAPFLQRNHDSYSAEGQPKPVAAPSLGRSLTP